MIPSLYEPGDPPDDWCDEHNWPAPCGACRAEEADLREDWEKERRLLDE